MDYGVDGCGTHPAHERARLFHAFKEVLQEEAAKEGRTLAGHIRYLINQARQKKK
jgi:hypothetical protein